MAVQNFVIELIEELLKDRDLALTEQDIRFYDKGTTAETDESLDDHIRWRNARYFNEDSNIIRSSILIIQLPFDNGTEFLNFQVGELYRLYRKGGMMGVLPIVKADVRDVKAAAKQNLALMNQFGKYEAIKDHLIIRPLNYDNNSKALARGIYRQVGDMALVLYISLGSIGQGASRNIISTMVLRDMMQKWSVDEKDTFEWALENTMRLQPPVVYYAVTGPDSRTASDRVRFMDADSDKVDFYHPFAPSLTTEQETNGAVAAFYPGVLDRIYQMVDNDFYLVFSSTLDVHIHPVDGEFKVKNMRNTLADMNRNANKPDEILSRQIYRYNGKQKEITVV